jgi:hypothetical protein
MLTFFLGVGFNIIKFGYGLKDGFWRTSMFAFEGTVWFSNFSGEDFLNVRLGMSQRQVTILLGDPLRKDDDCRAKCFWYYTNQDTGGC